MARGRKKIDRAVLRNRANLSAQTYATRRLLRDLKELETTKLPLVGVSARPLETDLFKWHYNLRGPEGTIYEGAVFHGEITFPDNYPHDPPKIVTYNSIKYHPNVFGNTVCVDLLDTDNRGENRGWTTGYTVLSLLVQLQSFLFEVPNLRITAEREKMENEIQECIRESRDFVCPYCDHKGALAPWPLFEKKEKDPANFTLNITPEQIYKERLICFHTKMTIDDFKLLGIGVSSSRVPRTGEIKAVTPSLDLISLKAFANENVRRSMSNEKFMYWLPLYFGINKEQVIDYTERALSMISTGTTKKFKPSMILDIFPKCIITIIYEMMDEKKHISLKAIRVLNYIHRLFLLMLEKHPELNDQIDEKLKSFIESEENRVKDVTPNLGVILSFMTVSRNTKWSDFVKVYIDEQLDRQAFWIMKDIPELVDEKVDQQHLDSERAEISFQSGIVSSRITLFYSFFVQKFANPEGKTQEELASQYDKYLGHISEDDEDAIQKECYRVRETKSFEEYYKSLGLPVPTTEDFTARLKAAIANSERKKYHGAEDNIHTLPEPNVQVEDLQKELISLKDEKFWNGSELVAEDDPKWKESILSNWEWIKDLSDQGLLDDMSPSDVSWMSDSIKSDVSSTHKDYGLVEKLIPKVSERTKEDTQYPSTPSDMTWRELFVKLFLEDFVYRMEFNPDFKLLYSLLDVAKPILRTFCLELFSIKRIKSGFHYLTALMTRLTKLETLTVVGKNEVTLSVKGIKALTKGIMNNVENGGAIRRLNFINTSVLNVSEGFDKFRDALLKLTNLKVLSFSGNPISVTPIARYFGNFLASHRGLEELNITNCSLVQESAKEIADGLMRAKELQIIRLNDNSSMAYDGLGSIMYSLAFSPRIRLIEAQRCFMSGTSGQFKEALFKLLKISASMESINLNRSNIGFALDTNFFKALGENKTMKFFDCGLSGNFSSSQAKDLGRAVAFNGREGNPLKEINLSGCITNISAMSELYRGLWISNFDHENWYGETAKAKKMVGADLEKSYHNNLTTFSVSSCNLHDAVGPNRKKEKIVDTSFTQFLTRSKDLAFLDISDANLDKKDADVLVRALDPEDGEYSARIKTLNLKNNTKFGKEGLKILSPALQKNVTIQVLDMSRTKLGVAGAYHIASALKVNSTIRELNLFNNGMDVDGARSIALALKENKTLEKLDIGSNSIRDKGLIALGENIRANSESKLTELGLRFNFISESGMERFATQLAGAGKLGLRRIYAKNNFISEPGIRTVREILTKGEKKIYFDFFDKLRFLEQHLLERCIWVSPINYLTPTTIKDFFMSKDVNCGIVLNVRCLRGQTIAGKPQSNNFALVEFAHVNSVTRSLHLASKKKSTINGNRVRIFRAGTSTSVYVKPPKSKSTRDGRGAGARGRGGRGRGRGAKRTWA